ncbi:MAG: polysaccharide biosynthesis/export family protein [Bacteroidales bacterium]|nr:polysaccharide biosynthesis/export family protein [Bacteroidales bacterium]
MIASLMLTSACVPYSKLKYLSDIDELSEPVVNPIKPKTISAFDKLRIIILSTDEQTSNLLNYSESSNSDQSNQSNTSGYIVDETGNISFPFVGKIEVEGLTLLEAGDKINNAIKSIITKPEVIVSFIDNKITVLGEFTLQGSYPINGDFVTLYEALALGQGLSQYADRKNVILLRKENNKLMHYKLDLTSSKITSDPLYYILPNDIIIAEPLRNKSWGLQSSMLSTITTTLSLILSIFYITTITKGN